MKSRYCVILIFTLFCTFSCKVSTPEDIIDESTMEDILYDYHIMHSAAYQQKDSANIYMHRYADAVFDKYGVTEAEFDSSLVWYSTHTEKLYKIYENINERLEAEASALGSDVSFKSQYSDLSANGDTANIWNGKIFYLLSAKNERYVTFSIDADSSFHPRDKFMLHYNSLFVYKEGMKDCIMGLCVQYDNDSIGSVTYHSYGGGENSVSIETIDRPIKRVYGFIYLNAENSEYDKIMCVMNPNLIRFHYKEPEQTTIELSEDSQNDSIENINSESNGLINKEHNRPLPMKIEQEITWD